MSNTPRTDFVENGHNPVRAMPHLCRDMERENTNLKDTIIAIMAASPRVTCKSFHHEKKDQHGSDEACPCVLRWELALKDAGELL